MKFLEDRTAVILCVLLSACLYMRKENKFISHYPPLHSSFTRGQQARSQDGQDVHESQGRDQPNICAPGTAEEQAGKVQKVLAAGLQCCWMHGPEERDRRLGSQGEQDGRKRAGNREKLRYGGGKPGRTGREERAEGSREEVRREEPAPDHCHPHPH